MNKLIKSCVHHLWTEVDRVFHIRFTHLRHELPKKFQRCHSIGSFCWVTASKFLHEWYDKVETDVVLRTVSEGKPLE